MTEAILTLGIFAVPILAVAIIEQSKMELERRKRIREMELMEQLKHGMAYRYEYFKQSVLNTERQQVDKEEIGDKYERSNINSRNFRSAYFGCCDD